MTDYVGKRRNGWTVDPRGIATLDESFQFTTEWDQTLRPAPPDDLLDLAQIVGVVPPFRCEQTWEGQRGIARCILPDGHDSACVLGIHT